MKLKPILINILPLPLWIIYYLLTTSNKELFMMPMDDKICLMIVIAFTIYNIFSKNVKEFFARNLIGIISLTIGCLISGQIYLKLFFHMSDDHYAVNSISLDIAISALVMTAVIGLVKFFTILILRKIKTE